MEVEQRHRGIKKNFRPGGKVPLRAVVAARKEFPPPVPEQKEAGGQGVEQAALRDEERERDAFPRDFVLVVGEVERSYKLEADEAAVEEEAGNGKRSAPAVERDTGEQRRDKSDPHKRAIHVHAAENQEAVEEVHAERVVQFHTGEDGIIRPEWGAVREVVDVSQMEREVAEVVGGDEFDFVAVGERQPQKRAQRKKREADDDDPLPRIERERLRLSRRPAQEQEARRYPEPERPRCNGGTQSAGGEGKNHRRDHRDADGDQACGDPFHREVPARNSGSRSGKMPLNFSELK